MIEQPAKVMRVGNMIRQLLEEVRAAPLDEKSRARLKEIHASSIKELEDGLAPELVDELERLSLPFAEDEIPSESELRIAQAQLVGWLEGLFHGIQTTLFAQQMAARAQLEQMRRALPPGMMPPGRVEAAMRSAAARHPGLTCSRSRQARQAADSGREQRAGQAWPDRILASQSAASRKSASDLSSWLARRARRLWRSCPAGRRRLRVTAEEPHGAAHPAQAHQRFADPGLGDMALAVDEEAVPADAVAGRPGLDPGQVDTAEGELAEYVHQRARMIVHQERHHRGLVGSARAGQLAGQPDRDEPGDRVVPVVHAGGQRHQPVQLGREHVQPVPRPGRLLAPARLRRSSTRLAASRHAAGCAASQLRHCGCATG